MNEIPQPKTLYAIQFAFPSTFEIHVRIADIRLLHEVEGFDYVSCMTDGGPLRGWRIDINPCWDFEECKAHLTAHFEAVSRKLKEG